MIDSAPRWPGGGNTPLYKLYRYVPPQRVGFLSRFGLKTGIDFDRPENEKFTVVCSRSLQNLEFGHFALLFGRLDF